KTSSSPRRRASSYAYWSRQATPSSAGRRWSRSPEPRFRATQAARQKGEPRSPRAPDLDLSQGGPELLVAIDRSREARALTEQVLLLPRIGGQVVQPESAAVARDELEIAIDERAPLGVVRPLGHVHENGTRRGRVPRRTGDVEQQRLPAHEIGVLPRRLRQLEEVEERRHQIDEASPYADTVRRDSRDAHDERHAHELLPELEAMANQPMLAEGLAVIARQDHDGAVPRGTLPETVEQAPDVMVREGDLAVVARATVRAEVEALVRHVLRVRVGVVNPQKEPLVPKLRARDLGERRVGELVARGGAIPLDLRRLRGRARVDGIEPALHPVLLEEVPIPVHARGLDAGFLEPLRDERIRGAEAIEMRVAAVRLRAVLADEHRREALRGVGRQRVRPLEHHAFARELVDAR